MKLISLNTWAGHEYDALMKFIGDQMEGTDIFCFQEMTMSKDGPRFSNGTRTNLMSDMAGLLEAFVAESTEFESGFDEEGSVDFDIRWVQPIFIRDDIEITDFGSTIIHDGDESHRAEFDYRCIMQYVKLRRDGKSVAIYNVHGVAYPSEKLDTPARLKQSERIKAFLSDIDDPVILCGDFNLLPETESIRMLGGGMENLIKTHKIKTTRGSLNPYIGTPQHQEFADYMFVSEGVAVEGFSVPDARVSDHLPMILTFAL